MEATCLALARGAQSIQGPALVLGGFAVEWVNSGDLDHRPSAADPLDRFSALSVFCLGMGVDPVDL